MGKLLGFDWDDQKASSNLESHKLSFETAVQVFDDPDLILVDTTRLQEKEARTKAIGQIDGRLFIVVFTVRGSEKRLISACRANAKEERAYASQGT